MPLERLAVVELLLVAVSLLRAGRVVHSNMWWLFARVNAQVTYAQSFMCLSLSTSTINQVATMLQYYRPFVYDSNVVRP